MHQAQGFEAQGVFVFEDNAVAFDGADHAGGELRELGRHGDLGEVFLLAGEDKAGLIFAKPQGMGR